MLELLSKPQAHSPNSWMQGDMAQDSRGNAVHIRAKQAVCWCLVGAAYHTIRQLYPHDSLYLGYAKFSKALKETAGIDDLIAWNDDITTTFADITDVLKKLSGAGVKELP